MISAWQVYLVMQLDGIKNFLSIPALIVATLCGVGVLMFPLILDVIDSSDIERETVIKAAKRIVLSAFVCGALATAIPSSKTAAAMILLPALTSDSAVATVVPEARELYELAKDALRSVAAKPEAEKPEK